MSISKQWASEHRHLSASRWTLRSAVVACALLGTACGGGATPEAETPKTEPAADDSAAKSTETTSAAAAAPAETEPSKPKEGAARSVLLHEGTAFLLNHEKSDMGIKASETCETQSKGDVAKKANCFSKAMNKMKREGFMLEAPKQSDDDDDGEGEAKTETWIYVGFNIEKGIKVETNRVEVDISDSGSSLTVKTKGPDKAKRRQGTLPSSITFQVPDEYTVLVNDSPRGKLVYEPKLGLFAGDN